MNTFVYNLLMGQLRHLLTIVAGALVAKGYLDAAMVEAFVGIALGIIGAGWSAIEKKGR